MKLFLGKKIFLREFLFHLCSSPVLDPSAGKGKFEPKDLDTLFSLCRTLWAEQRHGPFWHAGAPQLLAALWEGRSG